MGYLASHFLEYAPPLEAEEQFNTILLATIMLSTFKYTNEEIKKIFNPENEREFTRDEVSPPTKFTRLLKRIAPNILIYEALLSDNPSLMNEHGAFLNQCLRSGINYTTHPHLFGADYTPGPILRQCV